MTEPEKPNPEPPTIEALKAKYPGGYYCEECGEPLDWDGNESDGAPHICPGEEGDEHEPWSEEDWKEP